MPANATAALCGTSEAPALITFGKGWGFSVDGRLDEVPKARRQIQKILTGLSLAGTVALAGSELVTNSARYSRSFGKRDSILIEINLSDTALLLAVTDDGAADRPAKLDLDTDDDFAPDGLSVSGRGYPLLCGLVGTDGQVGFLERVWPETKRTSWALWSLR